MRYLFLLISLLIFGLVVYLQWGVISRVFYTSGSPDNSSNVNVMLEENQKDMDQYDQYIEDVQQQTEEALKGHL